MFNVAIKYKSRLYLISQLSQVWWNPCSYSAAVSWFEGFRLPTLQENRTVQTLSGKNLPSISAFAKFYGNQLRVLCTIRMKCFTSLLYYWKSQGQTLTKSTFGHALLSIYRASVYIQMNTAVTFLCCDCNPTRVDRVTFTDHFSIAEGKKRTGLAKTRGNLRNAMWRAMQEAQYKISFYSVMFQHWQSVFKSLKLSNVPCIAKFASLCGCVWGKL